MFELAVNSESRHVDAEAEIPLLWVLRDILDLAGTKYGCGVCKVRLDGKAMLCCVISVAEVGARKATTIEGRSRDRSHPVQQAWIVGQTPQCGYCQSGIIMMAAALVTMNPSPSDEQIEEAITNICRCGPYSGSSHS